MIWSEDKSVERIVDLVRGEKIKWEDRRSGERDGIMR